MVNYSHVLHIQALQFWSVFAIIFPVHQTKLVAKLIATSMIQIRHEIQVTTVGTTDYKLTKRNTSDKCVCVISAHKHNKMI